MIIKSLPTQIIGVLMAVVSPLGVWCGVELANKDYVTAGLLLAITSFLEYFISINWIDKTKS